VSNPQQWLIDLSRSAGPAVDGLVSVKGYTKNGRSPEEVAMMEKAGDYGATAVLFEAQHDGRPPLPQAFVFVSDGPAQDQDFARLHQRLWSWGGVPLVYRVTSGLVQLFRCAHKADFESQGEVVFKPHKTLKIAAQIAGNKVKELAKAKGINIRTLMSTKTDTGTKFNDLVNAYIERTPDVMELAKAQYEAAKSIGAEASEDDLFAGVDEAAA